MKCLTKSPKSPAQARSWTEGERRNVSRAPSDALITSMRRRHIGFAVIFRLEADGNLGEHEVSHLRPNRRMSLIPGDRQMEASDVDEPCEARRSGQGWECSTRVRMQQMSCWGRGKLFYEVYHPSAYQRPRKYK